MHEFVELKDTGTAKWRDLCDKYCIANNTDDEKGISAFETIFVEHGVMTAPPEFFQAIVDGKYKPNEDGDGIVVCYPPNDGTWMWCDCEHDGEPEDMPASKFWDDGMHPLCSKHCYTCPECGKLVQIG